MNTDEIRGKRADLYRRYIADADSLAAHLNDEPSERARVTELAFTRCFARLDHRREESMFELILFREIVEASNQFGRAGKTRVVQGLRRVLQLSVAQTADILGWSETRVSDLEDELPDETGPPPEIDITPAFSSERLHRVARRAAWRRDVAVIVIVVLAGAIAVAAWEPWRRATRDLTRATNTETVFRDDGLVFAGEIDDKKWNMRAYEEKNGDVCLDLDVAGEFESFYCLTNFDLPLRAFVSPDRKHKTTFIFGYARREVGSLTVSERGGAPINVELVPAPRNLKRKEPSQMFVVTLPDTLLELENRAQGRDLGYQVHRLRLVAKEKQGARLGHQDIILGRPTS
ncbi:MAG: hypothetical protein ACRDLB_01310 [Actinomycetota bacterium]